MAGRQWLELFLFRHPEIAQRKTQTLNPTRVQKVNRTVFNDYLQKKYKQHNLFKSPQLL